MKLADYRIANAIRTMQSAAISALVGIYSQPPRRNAPGFIPPPGLKKTKGQPASSAHI
jgi:hypothetical protein